MALDYERVRLVKWLKFANTAIEKIISAIQCDTIKSSVSFLFFTPACSTSAIGRRAAWTD